MPMPVLEPSNSQMQASHSGSISPQ